MEAELAMGGSLRCPNLERKKRKLGNQGLGLVRGKMIVSRNKGSPEASKAKGNGERMQTPGRKVTVKTEKACRRTKSKPENRRTTSTSGMGGSKIPPKKIRKL